MTPNELTPDLAASIEATNEYFSRHRLLRYLYLSPEQGKIFASH